MKTLTLKKPWDYVPNKRHHRNFPAGTHEVADHIYDAAVKDGRVEGVKAEDKAEDKPDAKSGANASTATAGAGKAAGNGGG